MSKKAMTKKKDSEVATINDVFDIRENMEGVEARLPQIGIIHQAQMFLMPDGSKVGAFKARILDVSRANAYWEESFDSSGGGTPPDCFSTDGIKPAHSESMQSDACATCPQNQFGSDEQKTGKACKNMKRVHVILSDQDNLIPFRLTVPPSNLKEVDKYITNLSGMGIPYQLVETIFSLRETKSKGGIKYSLLVLEAGAQVQHRESALRFKAQRDEWLPIMRGQAVSAVES